MELDRIKEKEKDQWDTVLTLLYIASFVCDSKM